MLSDAGAARGATVRATVDVVVKMFMEMSFERECLPAGARSAPGKADTPPGPALPLAAKRSALGAKP